MVDRVADEPRSSSPKASRRSPTHHGARRRRQHLRDAHPAAADRTRRRHRGALGHQVHLGSQRRTAWAGGHDQRQPPRRDRGVVARRRDHGTARSSWRSRAAPSTCDSRRRRRPARAAARRHPASTRCATRASGDHLDRGARGGAGAADAAIARSRLWLPATSLGGRIDVGAPTPWPAEHTIPRGPHPASVGSARRHLYADLENTRSAERRSPPLRTPSSGHLLTLGTPRYPTVGA